MKSFNELVDQRGRYASLFEIARQSNIVALKAQGEYGVLQSTASDSVLLLTYASTGQWAPRTNNLFKDFFAQHAGGIYIDIGANIGLTTIPVAKDPRVMCLAIEPEPVNSNLVANVAANCHQGNVETLQLAVFSRRGTVALELCDDGNIGDNRLRLSEAAGQLREEEWRTVNVTAVPLDEIAPKRDGALGIKIDTQGAAPFIFEGGPKTLARAGLIVLEFWPYGMARMGANPESVITFLENHFHVGSFAEGENGSIPADRPMVMIASELRQSFEIKRCDPDWYGDVIANRQ